MPEINPASQALSPTIAQPLSPAQQEAIAQVYQALPKEIAELLIDPNGKALLHYRNAVELEVKLPLKQRNQLIEGVGVLRSALESYTIASRLFIKSGDTEVCVTIQ